MVKNQISSLNCSAFVVQLSEICVKNNNENVKL